MVRLGLITCVLVAVGSTAAATPEKPPPCSVANPDAFIPLAIATPVVAALGARNWRVAGSYTYCVSHFVEVTVTLTPLDRAIWPADTRLETRLAFDANADASFAQWTEYKALLAVLDRLWKLPAVKRFHQITGIKHVDIRFEAGATLPMREAPLVTAAGVTLLNREFKSTRTIEDASGLRLAVGANHSEVSQFWIRDPALLPALDTFVPGLTSRCKVPPQTPLVEYDRRLAKLTLSQDPRCPTCRAQTECSLQ